MNFSQMWKLLIENFIRQTLSFGNLFHLDFAAAQTQHSNDSTWFPGTWSWFDEVSHLISRKAHVDSVDILTNSAASFMTHNLRVSLSYCSDSLDFIFTPRIQRKFNVRHFFRLVRNAAATQTPIIKALAARSCQSHDHSFALSLSRSLALSLAEEEPSNEIIDQQVVFSTGGAPFIHRAAAAGQMAKGIKPTMTMTKTKRFP
jgi:hypothetical protein